MLGVFGMRPVERVRMNTLTVQGTNRCVLPDGRHRTSARFVLNRRRRIEAYFETEPDVQFLEENLGDLWVAPAMVIAMRHGATLKLADPVSPGRREDLGIIQDVFATWYPDVMTRVPLRLRKGTPLPRRPLREDQRVVGACFTGGVDSFYTLLRNGTANVGALVYGHGLDVPEDQSPFAGRVEQLLDSVSLETGIPLLSARTNLRRVLSWGSVRWGKDGHGAALASLGTVFSSRLRALRVPSTHSYLDNLPWGSHPLLDHRWSTNRLKIIYDGAEADRVEKTEFIADSPLAQRHLRVCFSQFEALNCGRCEKCVRTMLTLEMAGSLNRFRYFEPLDLNELRTFELPSERAAYRFRKIQALAESRDDADPGLLAALSDILGRYETSSSRSQPRDHHLLKV